MAAARVIRIPRSDEPDAFVLLHVQNLGPAPLDVKITATEGEFPFTTVVQESHAESLKAKNSQGSDQEWVQILSSILGQSMATNKSASLDGVEATAGIAGSGDEGKEIIITIRKKVQSITQKLGSIRLKQDNEQAIELFEWSGIAAATADSFRAETATLTDRYQVAEDTISQLKSQLQDLVQAKDQHEKQLMTNFVQLLNEKKLKIRTQQRLLSSATVDPIKVSELRTTAAAAPGFSQVKSQIPKRGAQDMDESEGPSHDNLDQMDLDRPDSPDSFANRTTDDEELPTPPTIGKQDTLSDDDDELSREVPPPDTRPTPEESTHQAPPRRDLPFTRRAPPGSKQESKNEENPVAGDAAEETAGETDDDEL